MTIALKARRLLRARRHGALATLSRRLHGYPFGSVVPFMLDHEACPVILVSRLAEHTKNIAADPRVSLLVFEGGAEVQAESRVTLIGDCAIVAEADRIRDRYLRLFPDAQRLLDLGDFDFHRITPVQLRFIAGFGRIEWIAAQSYAPPHSELAELERDICGHMNADHAPALRDYCRHYHRIETDAAVMVAIDCDGFDVQAGGRLLRFDFPQPVTDSVQVRAALVAMAGASRSA
jgi:putative heme iron utilization protein